MGLRRKDKQGVLISIGELHLLLRTIGLISLKLECSMESSDGLVNSGPKAGWPVTWMFLTQKLLLQQGFSLQTSCASRSVVINFVRALERGFRPKACSLSLFSN